MLSCLQISVSALQHNLRILRARRTPSIHIAAAVKGNAYGHGQTLVSATLANDVDYFQIDDVEELRVLRSTTQKPALLLGFVERADIEEVFALKATTALIDPCSLPGFQRAAELLGITADLHLSVDTGMGREGVLVKDLEALFTALKTSPNLRLTGMYSHLATADAYPELKYVEEQKRALSEAMSKARVAGYSNLRVHISGTADLFGAEGDPDTSYIARTGLGLYGMWPSENLHNAFAVKMTELHPVLRWLTKVASVKEVPPGEGIGYGRAFVTKRNTKVALLPLGYSDGFDRGFTNNGVVLVRGVRCPVIGRVSMNMTTIDVSHLPEVIQEDEVVLLGSQGADTITAEELAERIGTINYEITTRISPLLPRFLVP